MDNILHTLNDPQREAVTLPETHALILAGAGSGKTRVLVHRLAWLFHHHQLSSHQILAVTFTNKAAHEMRSRIEALFNISVAGLWIGTFHGLAHRFLRLHYEVAKLPQSFQILDSEDQYRLIRRILKQLNIDEQYCPPRQVQHFINEQKDAMRRAAHIHPQHDRQLIMLTQIYQYYEAACQQNGVCDFAELLLRSYEVLRDHAEIREHYQQRFRHILIDEFQDTNQLQYAWIRLFAGNKNAVMAVGDDDQSIYGWRGAQIENITRLQQDFTPISVIRLEQNYRSTQTILNAANAVIAHNTDRMGKALWTAGAIGDPIQLYAAFNELDEARWIVTQLQHYLLQGYTRREMAILYRSNAQSRVLEEALINTQIPYRIYGGLRFFERAEIKDALAYLRLLANRHDDTAFERIINVPTRGIGERSVEQIREIARTQHCSLWQASQHLLSNQLLATRTANALQGFLHLFDHLQSMTQTLNLGDQVHHVITLTELTEYYQKEGPEKAQTRLENLAELVTAAKQFSPQAFEPGAISTLDAFLAHAALEAGETQADHLEDSVQLMTLHSAKGLEFPIVFISGLEEDLFPARLSVEDPKRLAEERRLCYVGMTRAMQQLILTYAESRRLYGESQRHFPSRFLREIPKEYKSEIRMKSSIQFATSSASSCSRQPEPGISQQNTHWRVGQTVTHAKFGQGIVINYENQTDPRLQIRFSNGETKWLLASFLQ